MFVYLLIPVGLIEGYWLGDSEGYWVGSALGALGVDARIRVGPVDAVAGKVCWVPVGAVIIGIIMHQRFYTTVV